MKGEMCFWEGEKGCGIRFCGVFWGAAVCFAAVSSYRETVFVADRGGAKVVALGVDENMEFSFLERWSFNTLEQHSRNQKDFGIVPKLGEY